MPNPTLVTIDDSDSRLIYQGNWFTNRSSEEYIPTVHGTQDVGASVKFSFNGTRVQVFGTADDSHASANFTLDGGAPTQYQQIPSSPSAYHIVLYNSPLLDDSEHTLVITSTAKNATLWLDYLQLASDSPTPSTIPSSISAGLSPNSPQDYQPFSSLSPAQAKNLDASASTDPTSPSQPMEPGLIALMVLGSVLLLMVIATGIILWCHCRGRHLRKSRTLQERGFDLLPAAESEGQAMRRPAMAMVRDFMTQRRAQLPAQAAQSSTLFTSVIMSPTWSGRPSDPSHARYTVRNM